MTNQISTVNQDFTEVVQLISAARQHAFRSVNTALIELYEALKTILCKPTPAMQAVIEKYGNLAFLNLSETGMEMFAYQKQIHPMILQGEITLDDLTVIDQIAQKQKLSVLQLAMKFNLWKSEAFKAWIEKNR